MSEYVTKVELDRVLRKQTDEIAGIVSSFVEQVDQRFNKIEQRQDAFELRFDRLEARMDEFDRKLDRLIGTIDGFLKRPDEVETEQAARDSQFERLLAWARKVSEKTGIPLENL